jgi:hypothetical protein
MPAEETLNTESKSQETPAPSAEVKIPTGPVSTLDARREARYPRSAEDTAKKATEDTTVIDKGEIDKGKEEKATEVKTDGQDKDKGKTETDKGPVPYDRFQEVIKERNETTKRMSRLETQLETVTSQLNQVLQQKADATPKIKIDRDSLSKLIEEEGTEAAMLAVYNQALHDAKNELSSTLSDHRTRETITSSLKEFTKQFPDFNELWDSGEIQRIADSNPMFNTPAAAYFMLTREKHIKDAVESAVDKARKEEREAADAKIKKIQDDYKAKRNTTVITETHERPSSEAVNADLKDTRGNRNRVLAERLVQRRRANGITDF